MHDYSAPQKETLEKAFRQASHISLNRKKTENSFLHTLSEDSYQAFTKQHLPTNRDEAYRHTPLIEQIAPLFTNYLSPPTEVSEELILRPKTLQNIDTYTITFSNGLLVNSPEENGSFQLYTLEQAHALFPKLVQKHFNAQARRGNDPWVHLNTVLYHTAYMLYLPPHASPKKPILLHHHISSHTPTAIYPRILIFAEHHTELSLIETFTTPKIVPPSLLNRVTEISLQPYSELTYYPLQLDQSPTHQLRYTYVQQKQHSHFTQHFAVASLNDVLTRDETNVCMQGQNATSTLYGTYSNDENKHLAIYTHVYHEASHTTSTQDYYGIGQNMSTTHFDGYVHIPPKKQKIIAEQNHKGWLLSNQATIHARPRLAIQSHDVQCRHGATTLQLDIEALLYMQTRGILPQKAKEILIQAFLEAKINFIPNPSIRQIIKNTLNKRIEKSMLKSNDHREETSTLPYLNT